MKLVTQQDLFRELDKRRKQKITDKISSFGLALVLVLLYWIGIISLLLSS